MSKVRDLINAHLYPVLATFSVIYGAIQIAPISQQARSFNACVQQGVEKNGTGLRTPIPLSCVRSALPSAMESRGRVFSATKVE